MLSRLKLLARGPATFALIVSLLALGVFAFSQRPMTPERFKTLNSRAKVEAIYRQHIFSMGTLDNLVPALAILSTGMEDGNPRVRQAAASTTNDMLDFLRMRADRNKPLHIEAVQGQELERIIFEGLQNPGDESYESFLLITWSLLTPESAFESLLLEQMQHADSEIKAQIWTALMIGWCEDDVFFNSVEQVLTDPQASQRLRNMAVLVAEETASPRLLNALPTLIDNENEDPYLRLRAMRALRGHADTVQDVKPLLEAQQLSQQWTDEELVEIAAYIHTVEHNPEGLANLYSMRSFYRKKDGPPLW